MISVDLSHLFFSRSQSFALSPAGSSDHRSPVAVESNEPSVAELSPLSGDAAQKVLSQALIASINQVLESEGAEPVESLYEQDFTPENLSSRLMGHINGVLADLEASGAQPEAVAHALQEMQKGIEQGFTEARDILQGMNALTDEVAQQFDATEAMLKQAMQERMAGGTDVAQAPSAVTYKEAESLQQASAATLQVQTRDGDIVNISLSRAFSTSTAKVLSADADGISYGMKQETRTSSHLSIEVSGELDKKELADIRKLVKRVDKITDKAADGNLQSAMKTAMKLGNNTGEIAAFSVDMSVESSYRSMSELSAAPASLVESQPVPVVEVDDVASLMAETDEIVRQADDLNLFADPQSLTQQLILQVMTAKLQILSADEAAKPDSSNDEMISSLRAAS